jgi:hypothetical protein
MAHYLVSIRTPMAPGTAFAYMADLTNFRRWDPGVTGSEQVVGTRPGADAAYDVWVTGLPTPLRYVTNHYEPPTRIVVQARNSLLTSVDAISVAADGAGSVVTYDARLSLNGPLAVLDPLLARVFRRNADRAAAGLVAALDGARVEHVVARRDTNAEPPAGRRS